MSPLNPISTWSTRGQLKNKLKPKAKYFLIAEGANTEYWYLSSLATRLSKQNKPRLIEICPVERTGNDRNNSNPKKLMEQAKIVSENNEIGFNKETDKVVIVFDADIYKGKVNEFNSFLAELKKEDIQAAVTYPNFELFLLLHKQNAVEEIIRPKESEILGKAKQKNFINKLANEKLGINTKSNKEVGELANDFEIASIEEKKLNQDLSQSIGRLTSNIAATIEQIIEEGDKK